MLPLALEHDIKSNQISQVFVFLFRAPTEIEHGEDSEVFHEHFVVVVSGIDPD